MTNKLQQNTNALTLTVEEMQALSLAKLSELHNQLAEEPKSNKKARLQKDMIAGIIKSKTSEAKAKKEAEQQELQLVENSAKPKTKAKGKAGKSKGAIGKKAPKIPADKVEAHAIAEQAEPEAEKPKKKAGKLSKKATVKKPDLKKVPKDVQEYVSHLETEAIKFPEVMEGEKFDFVKRDFEELRDLQKALLENIYSVYLFIDEKIDDELTQFLVTYANENLILVVDKSRNSDTIVQIHPEELQEGKYTYKEGKQTFSFDYSFYIKEKK
jgi:hypothetical protein